MKKECYPASVRSEDFGVWPGDMKRKEESCLHGWKRKVYSGIRNSDILEEAVLPCRKIIGSLCPYSS